MSAAAEEPRFLLLHLDAPLMAFAVPMVDHHGVTGCCPGLAQLCGLFANALGWHHRDVDRLERLQERLRFASVVLRPGRTLVDYQTVDLGQEHLVDCGWTSRGQREDRGKGEATRGIHIRLRHYWADRALLLALGLEPAAEAPTLEALRAALDEPERPLFIGRKTCLPAVPLVWGCVAAADPRSALLRGLARMPGLQPAQRLKGEWPAPDDATPEAIGAERIDRRIDRRDWRNQVHGGERLVAVGWYEVPDPACDRAAAP